MEHKEVDSQPAEVPSDAQSRLKIVIFKGRELPGNYHSVVIARWLNSLKRLNKMFRLIDQEAYYTEYQKYIKNIITRPNVVVRLAALEEDIDVIFGWSVSEGDVLHYVHIQDPYRKQRISYDLIPKETKWVTHITKHWEERFMKKPKGKFRHVKFNPFRY